MAVVMSPLSFTIVVGFGLLLAIASLLWGAVYDLTLSLFLICLVGMWFMMSLRVRREPLHHSRIRMIGTALIVFFLVTLALQRLLPMRADAIFLEAANGLAPHETLQHVFLYNLTGWYQASGRLMAICLTFYIACMVGPNRKLVNDCIWAFLIGSALLVTFTFTVTIPDKIQDHYSYSHGFVNPNHAASYLTILIILTLWQLHYQCRRMKLHQWHRFAHWFDNLSLWQMTRLLFLSFALLLFISAILLTKSRGGLLVCSASCFVFLTIASMKALRASRSFFSWAVAGLFVSGFIVSVGWLLQGYGAFFHETFSREGVDLAGRPILYLTSLEMIIDHPLLGVGLGNYASVFPLYRTDAMLAEGVVLRAHSSYLQLAAEMGIPAFMALMLVNFYVGYRFLRELAIRRKHYGYALLGFTLWTSFNAHSLFDFPLQMPSLGVTAVALIIFCACQSDKRHRLLFKSGH